MSDFQREERYIVVKMKDLDHTQLHQLYAALDQQGIPTRECVVVESDWLIYEAVWDMVQRMAEGRPQRVAELEDQVERLVSACRAAARKESRQGNYAAHIEALDEACEETSDVSPSALLTGLKCPDGDTCRHSLQGETCGDPLCQRGDAS